MKRNHTMMQFLNGMLPQTENTGNALPKWPLT